ncbi:MAG: hypothetical protein WC300_00085 [Candidatus Omnitrophota bacterium]
MKCIIVYFSFSGNTQIAAEAFASALKDAAQVDVIRPMLRQRYSGFWS